MPEPAAHLVQGPEPTLVDGAGIPVSLRPTVRRLLGELLASPDRRLRAEDLVARVWGEDRPSDPVASLHTTVARLRRVLPPNAVRRDGDGYRLDLPADFEIGPDRAESVMTASHADVLADSARTSFPPPVVHRPWRLVGRNRFVDEAVEAASASPPRGTVFFGDAGIGSSRVADEVLVRLAELGHPTVALRARAASASLPLGVFAPLLAGTLPEEGIPMLLGARRAIRSGLAGRRLVLGVDDLSALDSASALLLAHLVIDGDAVLVGTHRTLAAVREPVAQLWHEQFVRHVHLPELSSDEAFELATLVADGRSPQTALRSMCELTAGNPLHLTTLVRHGDPATAAGDASLERLVSERLEGLPAELHDTLVVVALAEPIGASVVESLTDLESLVSLERAGLIVTERSGRRLDVRVRHPLYGEHVRATASRLLSRGVRAQLADAVVALGARRHDDPVRVASWSLDSGRPIEAWIGVAAARAALAGRDMGLADRIATDVWERERSVDAGLVMVEACYLGCPGARSAEVARDVLDAARSADDDRQFHAASLLARILAQKCDDLAGALDVLGYADGRVDSDVLVPVTARLLAHAGRASAVFTVLEAHRGSDARSRVRAALAAGSALGQVGRADEALAELEVADRLLGDLGDLAALAVHQVTAARAHPLTVAGRLDEAVASVEPAVDAAASIGDDVSAGLNAVALTTLLAWCGRPAEGESWGRRAVGIFERSSHAALARTAWASAGFASLTAGHVDDVRAAVDVLERSGEPSSADGLTWLLRGGLARLERRPADAVSLWTAGAAWCREAEMVLEEMCLLDELASVDVLDPAGWERAATLGQRVGGLVQALALGMDARRTDDPEAWARAAERFGACGAHGHAARAWASAAVADARAGRAARAAASRERWRDHRLRCDAPVAPGPLLSPDPPTDREREVALLAASGATNPEIATLLGVSVRTVDNHLARVFDKLGIDGRTALAELLEP